MPLVVGLDEAGYGPLLGPLVVGATVWRVAPRVATGDFWEHLAACVSRKARRGDARLPVADSKQVYDRKQGLATLERTVLAFAHAAGLRWTRAGDLLDGLGFVRGPTVGTFPWYADLSRRLPVDPVHSAYEGAAARLAAEMARQQVACCGLRVEVIPEDVFNRRLAQTHNKAAVLLEAVLRLIHHAAGAAHDQDVYVLVDRLGGRADYRALLMAAFPDRHLHVVEQAETVSRYRLAGPRSDWHLSFVVDGDQQHLPIALASMLAKYVRELLMLEFNAYWQRLAPNLRPTAGYYVDAQRFLAELGPVAAQARLPLERFVRAR